MTKLIQNKICFVPETENPRAQWVTPCRCAGSLGHVHQDCVKRWVEEKQNGNIDLDGESFTPNYPAICRILVTATLSPIEKARTKSFSDLSSM